MAHALPRARRPQQSLPQQQPQQSVRALSGVSLVMLLLLSLAARRASGFVVVPSSSRGSRPAVAVWRAAASRAAAASRWVWGLIGL